MRKKIKKYDFYKTKYGDELLIDLIPLDKLEKYIREDCPHYLTYYDITFIIRGTGTLSIDQFDFQIQAGKVLFSSPGQVRFWNINKVPKGLVLLFEEEFLSLFMNDTHFIEELKYFNSQTSPPVLKLSQDEGADLERLMNDIKHEISTFKSTDKHILRALLYQVLVWLDRRYALNHPQVKNTISNPYVSAFVRIVNTGQYLSRPVSFFADKLNITAGHLSDLCNSYLGISAKKFILNRTITEAKRLLKYSSMPVNEIARILNYEDPSYFIRLFKNQTGLTPLVFRKDKKP